MSYDDATVPQMGDKARPYLETKKKERKEKKEERERRKERRERKREEKRGYMWNEVMNIQINE